MSDYIVMITMTYPATFPTSGKECKRHLERFRKTLERAGHLPASACWFLEFQQRGAPHFHVLLTAYVPHGVIAEAWALSTYGLASKKAGTSVVGVQSGMHAYALKSYGAKLAQKSVPECFHDVGRFWGVWGVSDMRPVEATTRPISDELRTFAMNHASETLKRHGYKVYEVPFGFVAYPGERK